MNMQFVFSLPPGQANVSEKIIAYFKQHGFFSNPQADRLCFKRNSWVAALLPLNPLKWNSEIIVIFSRNQVYVYAEVSTLGKLTTPRVKATWRQFLEDILPFIQQEENLDQEEKETNEIELLSVATTFGFFVAMMTAIVLTTAYVLVCLIQNLI